MNFKKFDEKWGCFRLKLKGGANHFVKESGAAHGYFHT